MYVFWIMLQKQPSIGAWVTSKYLLVTQIHSNKISNLILGIVQQKWPNSFHRFCFSAKWIRDTFTWRLYSCISFPALSNITRPRMTGWYLPKKNEHKGIKKVLSAIFLIPIPSPHCKGTGPSGLRTPDLWTSHNNQSWEAEQNHLLIHWVSEAGWQVALTQSHACSHAIPRMLTLLKQLFLWSSQRMLSVYFQLTKKSGDEQFAGREPFCNLGSACS